MAPKPPRQPPTPGIPGIPLPPRPDARRDPTDPPRSARTESPLPNDELARAQRKREHAEQRREAAELEAERERWRNQDLEERLAEIEKRSQTPRVEASPAPTPQPSFWHSKGGQAIALALAAAIGGGGVFGVTRGEKPDTAEAVITRLGAIESSVNKFERRQADSERWARQWQKRAERIEEVNEARFHKLGMRVEGLRAPPEDEWAWKSESLGTRTTPPSWRLSTQQGENVRIAPAPVPP